ncbi:unnamed protein product [Camellia sinensis]
MEKRKSSETPDTPSKKQKLSQSSYGLGSKTSTKTSQTLSQNTQVQADEATSIQMSTPTSKDSSSREKKPVKLHRKRAHYSIQFRSNLSSVVSFFQTLKFSSKHLLELQKTPFWYLIQALTTGRMDPKKSRKSDDDVVAIIQCYNEKTKAFTVGKKNLTFTRNDMTLIFGLEGGKGAMSLRYSKKPKSAFLRRRFQKDTRLTGPVLKNALVKAMKGKQPTDFKDVAIIVTLYLCLTLFFATSGNSIGWVFIKYVEPLESMKQYDWPEAITSTLIDSIMALHKTPEKVTGCVIALLVNSNTTDFPRCAKWNLQTLMKQLQKTPIHSLAPQQIDNKQLVKNPSEELCLGNKTKKELKKAIVKFKETLQDPSEDRGTEHQASSAEEETSKESEEEEEENNEHEEEDSEQEHKHEEEEIEPEHKEHKEQNEHEEEEEEIEPEHKEQNEHEEEDSEQEHEQEHESDEKEDSEQEHEEEDEQQEENKDESDEKENNEPMDKQHDGICGSTMHQPEEFEESKDAQIADLRQRLKALSQSKKEEDRNWIELLAEKDISIRILTSDNSELQEKESTIRMKLRMLEVEKANDTKTIQQLRCSNSELETENAKLHEQVQKTIQQLRCSNSELETENAKLHEQVQELSVQLATQPYRTPTQLQPQVGMQVEQQPTTQQEQMPQKQQPKQKTKLYVKKDPTSMIKNLKAKERKETQHDPEFQYPKVAKVTRASKKAAKQVEQSTKDEEVIDADEYILPQPINIRKPWVFPQNLPISRLIKDHIKDILQHISNVSGLDALIWTSELNLITFEDIGSLIKQKEIANNNFIKMTENPTFRVSLFDKHIETAWRNYRFLHFPINTGGNEKSTHGNHWTLLVLDKQNNLWRFYNSLRPRRDDEEDKYVKDAKQLQDYVENFLKACLERDAQSQPSFKLINSQNTSYDFEYVNNAPQQESDSLDCGLFVCYIMKQYTKHEPISSKLSTQEIRLMRAELIERFVTEVGRSWTEPIEIPPEEPQM